MQRAGLIRYTRGNVTRNLDAGSRPATEARQTKEPPGVSNGSFLLLYLLMDMDDVGHHSRDMYRSPDRKT